MSQTSKSHLGGFPLTLKLCDAVGGWAQTTQTESLTDSVKAFFYFPSAGAFNGGGCRAEASV